MKVPRLLLGVSLLAWGWQVGHPVLAGVLAALLEAASWLKWRWQLSAKDINRLVDLCALAFAGLAVYAGLANPAADAIFAGLKWMPVVMYPLVAVQAYSNYERLPLTALSMQQRRWGHSERTVDVGYPYFLLCLLAASTGNHSAPLFFLVIFALWVWALWPQRNKRFAFGVWLSFLLAGGGGGYLGHVGLVQLQLFLEGHIPEWVMSWFETSIDPYKRITAMGSIGRLKLSSRIVLRVAANRQGAVPALLRTASYNVLSGRYWIARTSVFTVLERQPDLSWQLRSTPASAGQSIQILQNVQDGNEMLPLPLGTYAIGTLPADRLERNPLGAVKVLEAPDLIRYTVAYDPAGENEQPNWPDDYDIPADYHDLLADIAAKLGLAQHPPSDVPAILENYFTADFSYSLDLSRKDDDLLPLIDFLRNTHSGHCEYFASATVLLLRQAGIPARYASGFSVQEYSPLEQRYVVRKRHAHSWAIAYIDGRWQNVDTTPPAWFEVDSRQAPVLTGLYDCISWLWLKIREWRLVADEEDSRAQWGWLLLPLSGMLVWRLRRRKWRFKGNPTVVHRPSAPGPGADSECYRIVDWYLSQGLERAPGETLARWLARVSSAPDETRRVGLLTEILRLHYRYRFDPAGISAAERDRLSGLVLDWFARGT